MAKEFTTHDALAAHVGVQLGINPAALVNPWHAAAASAISFNIGALLPLVAIILVPGSALAMAATYGIGQLFNLPTR